MKSIYEEALEQAQKQEKLLELYKKLTSIYETLHSMDLSELASKSHHYQIEILELNRKIEMLEYE